MIQKKKIETKIEEVEDILDDIDGEIIKYNKYK